MQSFEEFIIGMHSEFCSNTKWYEFESSIENVAGVIFSKQFYDVSNQVDYVHGSLSDDLDIVLGFSNDITPMDLASGLYTIYMKEVRKFKLKYLRFLKANGDTEKYKERLEEFQPHLDCLFSGKGGWAFPLNK